MTDRADWLVGEKSDRQVSSGSGSSVDSGDTEE